MADLKAEKERLESLAKEKGHADKLRTRITGLNTAITSKQDQYDTTKREYEELVKNNARFYESATKFRELYVKVENLQQKKEHYLQELSDARETVQEIEGAVHDVHISRDLTPVLPGSDEELLSRLRNFDDNIAQQKQRRRRQEVERQDLEDELARARKSHVDLVNEQGELAAEAKVLTIGLSYHSARHSSTHSHTTRPTNVESLNARSSFATSVTSTTSRVTITPPSNVKRLLNLSLGLGTSSGVNVPTTRSSRRKPRTRMMSITASQGGCTPNSRV